MNKAIAESLRILARFFEQAEEIQPQIPAAPPAEDYSSLNYQNLDEAAEALGVSEPLIRKLVHREDFPGYKAGTRWVIPKKSLAEWNAKMAKEKAEI